MDFLRSKFLFCTLLIIFVLSGCAAKLIENSSEFVSPLNLVCQTINTASPDDKKCVFQKVTKTTPYIYEMDIKSGRVVGDTLMKNLESWCTGKQGQLTFSGDFVPKTEVRKEITTHCIANNFPLFVGHLSLVVPLNELSGLGLYTGRFAQPVDPQAMAPAFLKTAAQLGYKEPLDASKQASVNLLIKVDEDLNNLTLITNLRAMIKISGGEGISALINVQNAPPNDKGEAKAVCVQRIFQQNADGTSYSNNIYYFDENGEFLRTDWNGLVFVFKNAGMNSAPPLPCKGKYSALK